MRLSNPVFAGEQIESRRHDRECLLVSLNKTLGTFGSIAGSAASLVRAETCICLFLYSPRRADHIRLLRRFSRQFFLHDEERPALNFFERPTGEPRCRDVDEADRGDDAEQRAGDVW